MPKKNEAPASFETALGELEQIVNRLESGDLPLEEALSEFERGVQLARQGQSQLQKAEQRVQILLADSEDSPTTPLRRTLNKWISRNNCRPVWNRQTKRCAVSSPAALSEHSAGGSDALWRIVRR